MTQHQSNRAAPDCGARITRSLDSEDQHGPADRASEPREAENEADDEPTSPTGYQWVWLGQFTWGDGCEGVTGDSRAEVTRKLLQFFESWRRKNPTTVVEDAWLTSPNYVHYGMKQRLCGPVPQPVPKRARKTAWTGKSQAERSAEISRRWEPRREKAIIKADDKIRAFLLRYADDPDPGFKDIDATIAKAVDINLSQGERDNARVCAVQIILNRGFGYPYDVWMKPSLAWWNMKQRQARE